MRESFANEIYEHSGLMATGDECFKFGITWGCRSDCPMFERGECREPMENLELIESTKDDNPRLYQKYMDKIKPTNHD